MKTKQLEKLPVKVTDGVSLGVIKIPQKDRTIFSLRQYQRIENELSIIFESENQDEVIQKFNLYSLYI